MEENKIDESVLDKNSINGFPMEAIDKLNEEQLQAVIDGKNAVEINWKPGSSEKYLEQIQRMRLSIVH